MKSLMKLRSNLVLAKIALTVLIISGGFLTWGGDTSRALGGPPESWVCFPTCSTVDGRFMSMAGANTSSLSGQVITVGVSAPYSPTVSEVFVDIFDGNATGQWDPMPAPSLTFELFADPLGDGTGASVPSNLVTTWSGATMPDNAWAALPSVINIPAAQQCSTCAYKYLLKISTSDVVSTGNNAFKIRTSGTIGVKAQTFAFIGAMSTLADFNAIYPTLNVPAVLGGNFTTLANTNYDGSWEFSFYPGASPPSISGTATSTLGTATV